MKLGIIIPAYNAENFIVSVIEQIKHYFDGDIIIVNDGSTDDTLKKLNQSDVIVLSHNENRGKGAALKTGFAKALKIGCEAVFTIDADGQHDPRFIPDFIAAIQQSDFDIIIGSRMHQLSAMPIHRIFSNKVTSGLISLRIGQRIMDSQSGYRLIKTNVIRKISLTTNHYDTESELLIKSGIAGYRIGYVNIQTIYNNEPSSMRIFTDTRRFVKLFWSSYLW
jgi:glycosyltransferase involved in cell wall biosynthesis